MEKVKLLAKSSLGQVVICKCCMVHVSIPGISLHLSDSQFTRLSQMVNEASDKLVDGALQMLSREEGEK